MQVKRVTQIEWHGRRISSFVILQDGPLSNDSIVMPATAYLLHAAKYSSSIETERAIAQDLKPFFEALQQANRNWEDITDDLMSGYIESTLLTALGLSKRSIHRHCSTLKGMYKFSSDYGYTENHFSFSFRYYDNDQQIEQGDGKKLINYKLNKKYINDDLFETILAFAHRTPGYFRDRNELILLLGKNLGLRNFEVTHPNNLKISDLSERISKAELNDKLSFSISIFGKGNKIRDIDVDPETISKIANFLEGSRKSIPGELLICNKNGSALGDSFATRLFNRAKNSALVQLKALISRLGKMDDPPYTISYDSTKNLTFHCLRHTFSTNLVTYCYLENIDPWSYLPDQLGHSNKKITKHYVNFEASIQNRDTLRKRFSKPLEPD